MTTKFNGNINMSGNLVATQAWVTAQGFGAGGGGSIDTLSDVDTSTSAPITGQVLKWNGSNWTPQADASGSSYTNSDVDTHLNQSNPTSGYVCCCKIYNCKCISSFVICKITIATK